MASRFLFEVVNGVIDAGMIVFGHLVSCWLVDWLLWYYLGADGEFHFEYEPVYWYLDRFGVWVCEDV